MTWLTALTAWPAPIGPTWVIVRPSAVEDRPGALDVGRVAADEDRQRRVLGALAAARDRRVDHRAGRAPRAAPRSPSCPTGAIVEQSMIERARARAADDAVLAEQDRLDVRACPRRRSTTISASAAAAAGFAADLDAEVGELGRAAGRPVPGGDREAGPGEVGGHRRAHRPEPEEGDALPRLGHGPIVDRWAGRVLATGPRCAARQP